MEIGKDSILSLIDIIVSKMQLGLCIQGKMYEICLYHLLKNFKIHFSRSDHNIKQSFNSKICMYTLSKFKYHMHQLDTMNEKIIEYLEIPFTLGLSLLYRSLFILQMIYLMTLHTYGVSTNEVKTWRSHEQTLKMIWGDPT